MTDKLSKAKLLALREKNRRDKLTSYKEDFEEFCKDQIKIITKDASQGFVPFIMNEAQQLIHERIEKQRKETGKVRALVLKARQQGISTYSAARCYWKTTNNDYIKTVVLAHDANTSDQLFDMTRNFVSYQPESTKPTVGKSNAKELKFTQTSSAYRVYTAGSPEAGRGTTPTILHCSEVAFWNHDDKILSGLFQGVADVDGTEIILESTANGATGKFYELWKGAERGDNGYIPVFIPWFLTSEYSTPAPKGFEKTHEEDEYAEKYGLSDDQVYWRRIKINQGGPDKFKQEYPANAEEAFLAEGSSVFDVEKLRKVIVQKPKGVEEYCPIRNSWTPNAHGSMEVWEYPKLGSQYIIGGDVAGGVGQDYSTAVVMNPMRQIIACYRNNKIDPGSFGDLLFYLGRWFNHGLIICESNNHGTATLHQLEKMKYPNIYYQTKIAQISNEASTTPGFRTTASTKPHIVAGLKRAIVEDDIYIPSNTIIDEMCNYIAKDNGKTEAAPGYHDDTVIATALCLEGLRTHGDKLSVNVDWKQFSQGLVQPETQWL